MEQFEMRMFAMYQEPIRLADTQIEAMTFESTLSLALEHGLKRFDRRTQTISCHQTVALLHADSLRLSAAMDRDSGSARTGKLQGAKRTGRR
jgi:hypothetical protein